MCIQNIKLMTQFDVSSIYSSQVLRVKSSSLLLTQFFQLLVAAHKTVSIIKLFLVTPPPISRRVHQL